MFHSSKTPWYSERAGFFGPDYLIEYSPILSAERTLLEVDFVERLMPSNVRILDLACGHGRHALELARRGYRITGLDLSAFFLAEARRRTGAGDMAVTWVLGDMRALPFGNGFGGVLSLFTSFGYLETEADDGRVISEVARVLRPDGRFILDVANRDWIERHFMERERREMDDGGSVLIERVFDRVKGRMLERRVRLLRGRAPQETKVSLRHYHVGELERMFQQAGLTVEAAYGDHDCTPFSSEARRAILIGRQDSERPAR